MPKHDTEPATTDPAAAKTEASDPGAPVIVDWNGRTWTFPPSANEWDVEAAEALELRQGVKFLRITLGPKQWAVFLAGDRRTAGDAGELMDIAMAAYGEAQAGE